MATTSQLPVQPNPGRMIGLMGFLVGLLAVGTPFLPNKLAFLVLGFLILIFGLLQNFAGFALRDSKAATSWLSRGGASILTGLLLMATPRLSFAGLAILLGLSWAVSGLNTIVSAIRRLDQSEWPWHLADGIVNVLLGLAIALQWPVSGIVSVSLFVGLRCVSEGWSILIGGSYIQSAMPAETADRHPDDRLGLAPHPYIGKLCRQITDEEVVRRRSDRAWCWVLLLTFFAIHAARMDTDWHLIGLLSPAGAVVGDAFVAVLFSYGIAVPILVTWHGVTRRIESKTWTRYLASVNNGNASGLRSSVVHWWLVRRLRMTLRSVQARGSATAALGWGFRTGLPAAAILMALTPLWGVNWFFDTESWVTGAWEMWADQRTDTWRMEMVNAVRNEYGATADDPSFFRVGPDGLAEAKDFSFVVIGDTGEGDASQHILRDQLIFVGQKPDVKFLVVSSDVIYPSGAMKDYEPKFYLPFKGFHKPIYAVPGNHDWYDALEAFNANFLEPKAARTALRARRAIDRGLTTTTEARIDGMVREAERLRGEYQIRVAGQRTPYFEILTDQFSLVVVDTGILRKVDDDQLAWLDKALERGHDRFKMAILGHPLYVASRYQGDDDEDFAKVHTVLKKHNVNVAMAGDTHNFEYYKVDDPSSGRSMYHFVNGGGGAYLSIGTTLDWPKIPLVPECGCYPRADLLTAKLDAQTPPWKRPLWWWTKRLHGWPSSREIVGAAFDYNRAPFFQSFIEVRVEGSTNTVRYWLYGCNGRLRWRDLHVQGGLIPNGKSADDLVEFAFPLRPTK
jgi:uncharacterized membrane protein HdeD (DUF308 family)